jgi:hypothetical protein
MSWNLMIGKNPLWVAKQHGHSVQTMLDVYAAWTDGTKESDIVAIKRAMDRARFNRRVAHPSRPQCPSCLQNLALAIHRCSASRGKIRDCNGGREGFMSQRN